MVSIAISSGMFMHGFQFYFEPMRRQFGWSRTLISGAYTLVAVGERFSGTTGRMAGAAFRLADCHGGRVRHSVGRAGAMLSLTQNVPMFYASFLILSIGSGLAAWTPVVPALTNWFRRKRAMAVGLTMMGMGFGGIVVAPVVAFFINNFSWDKTAMGCGNSRLDYRNSPGQDHALQPGTLRLPAGRGQTGGEATKGSDEPKAASSAEQEFDFTVREALRSPAFWLMSIGHSISLLTISSLSLHMVPYLETELGFSTERAATAVVAINAFLMAAQPVGGFLGDRLPKKYIVAGTLLGHASALLDFGPGRQLLAGDSGVGDTGDVVGDPGAGDNGDEGRILREEELSDDPGVFAPGADGRADSGADAAGLHGGQLQLQRGSEDNCLG